MKRNEIPELANVLNGWWCEACGEYVLKNEAKYDSVVWLCAKCAKSDLTPKTK